MINKKLATKIILGLMLATPYTAWADSLHYTESATITEDVNASEIFPDSPDDTSVNFNAILVNGENAVVSFTGENISSTMDAKAYFAGGEKDSYTLTAIQGASWNGAEGSTIQLGGENTKNIIIKAYVDGQNTTNGYGNGAIGLWAYNQYQKPDNQTNNGGLINVNGNNLEITVHSVQGSAYGILAQNSTTVTSADTPSTININTENTKIVATSGIEGGASGIVALSQGIVNINSNLEIDSDNAIVARGDAVVKINEFGQKSTKLNGDINFNYDKATSGTKVDADVLVNLTGENSYWNGNAVVSWGTGSIPDDKNDVSGLDLIIADGAQWNPTYVNESSDETSGTTAIAVNNLTANNGYINLDNMKEQEVRIEKLSGKKLNVNVASDDNRLSITESNEVKSLTVAANGTYAEELVKNDITDSLNNLANQVITTGNGKTAATDVAISETGVVGEITAQVGKDGKVDATTVKELTNSTTAGIGELANVAFMAWRAENDEMHQRMGELRSSTGEAGIWARMKRGESESGDLDITNQYNTYQLGYDEKVGDSNWYIGGAISRTEGKSSFSNGSGENKSTGFTVYGTYVGDDGQYVDLSAKYARLDNEFDVFGRDGIESTGDYRNNGYAFSAEYGKRIEAGNEFWVEPQVQLTYGHLSSADYTTSRGIKAAQDAMNSVVGRVGFAAGKDIGAGNVYVKASYLYDFDGDTSVTMNDGVNSRTYEQDLGGGWFEFGIGTNINLSETSHLYFDVERAVGGDIDTPWQWNAGVRFDF